MISSVAERAPSGGKRSLPRIDSLDSLVGGHPEALGMLFANGSPTDPGELGDAPRGRLLALVPGAELYMATRPLMRALATDLLPWRGKVFDHGGNSGQNVVLGRKMFRFQAEVGPSVIDQRPALVLTYDAEAYGNPWMVRVIRDELRTVGPGIAMGPAILTRRAGAPRPLFWFGLEIARGA
jgi:hypothetical protein